MLKYRYLVAMACGKILPTEWLLAVAQEPRTRAKPVACTGCPLRSGGEWEAGTKPALIAMTPAQRKKMKRWSCHADARPCAGMLRLIKETESTMPLDKTILDAGLQPAREKEWQAIATAPENTVVDTAIIDGRGQRNTARLRRSGRLWFYPDQSMYVYYTPTHWRLIKEIENTKELPQ